MRKFFINFTLFLMIATLSFFIASCSDNSDKYIDGVSNISISSEVTKYDFKKGVTTNDGDFTVDFSSVKFGTAGEYTVKYKTEHVEKTAKVKIYGLPSVVANNVELSYEEAVSGNTRGITAIDTFGETLAVRYVGLQKEKFYYPEKSYDVIYETLDCVGNKKEFTRKVYVKTCSVSDFGNISVDLDNYSIPFSFTSDKLIGISDENGIYYDCVTIKNNTAYGLNKIGSKLGIGTHEITIYFDKSIASCNLIVSDKNPIKYLFNYGNEKTGIDGYIYANGESVYFPEIINNVNSYQNLDVNYSLLKKGKEISFNTFSTDELGEYVYKIQINKNSESITLENTFYVVSEKEKNNMSFSVNTNQFVNNYQINYSDGNNLEYVGEIEDLNGEKHNAIKFSQNITSGSDEKRVFGFNPSILEKIIASGSTRVSMKVMFADEHEATPGFLFAYQSYWCASREQYYINPNTWTTLSFDLATSMTSPYDVPDLYTFDYLGNCSVFYKNIGLLVRPTSYSFKIYVSDVVFGEPKNVSPKTFYNFENGDSVYISSKLFSAKVGANSVEYNNIKISQNGVIKNTNGTSDDFLSCDTLGIINNNMLIYNGKEYYNFEYTSGKIYSVGNVVFDNYGQTLDDMDISISYKLLDVYGNNISSFNEKTLSANLKEGGYNLKLYCEQNGNHFAFDNYFYVAEKSSPMYTIYGNDYIRYSGEENGFDIFEIYDPLDVRGHKHTLLDSNVVDAMLDAGKNYISVYINTYTEYEPIDGQQIYRSVDYNLATATYTVDYWNVTNTQVGNFIEYKLYIDESMRGKSVGFSLFHNAKFYFSNLVFNSNANSISLKGVSVNGEISLCNDVVNGYLSLTDEDEIASYLLEYENKDNDYQNTLISWYSIGSEYYTVYIAENEDFINAQQFIVDKNFFVYGLAEPNITYYYKVVSKEGISSEIVSFKTKNDDVRILSIDSLYNVRDLGGRTTENGDKVKYGMLYRGGSLDTISDLGKNMLLSVLGVQTEIDLRKEASATDSMCSGMPQYLRAGIIGYGHIYPNVTAWPYDVDAASSIKSIFSYLADEKNYPIYFHCAYGSDRTGTVAFLIEGLLGFSIEDILQDYELSSFSPYGYMRYRADIENGKFVGEGSILALYNIAMENYGTKGGTLASAIENFLKTDCGVTQAEIDSIRNIMLVK